MMINALGFFLQSQNADGGWGYRSGKMSFVESTAAVLLVVSDQRARERGRDFILSLQGTDGGWGVAAGDDASGWMTAWAVRALTEFPAARDAVMRGVNWLLTIDGVRITDPAGRQSVRETLGFDSAIAGWPWQRNDALWVHPTALAIIALCAAGYRDAERAQEGVAFLFDRMTRDHGWNIGNPMMLGKQIPATIQDTAIALIALRAAGVAANDSRIDLALQFLSAMLMRSNTPADLAWGVFALREWHMDVGDARARLVALQNGDGSWQGNPFITAIAVLAGEK